MTPGFEAMSRALKMKVGCQPCLLELREAWCAGGRELVDFEIVPVRTSAEAAAVMAARDA
jgi:hypothetical protein